MMLGHIEDKRRKLLLLEKSLLNALCAAFDPFEICARSCSRHRVYNHSTQHARTCLFFESRFEPYRLEFDPLEGTDEQHGHS
jgi:hypothetical protein